MDLKITKGQMEDLLKEVAKLSPEPTAIDKIAQALGFKDGAGLKAHFEAPRPVLIYTVEDSIRSAMDEGVQIPADDTSLKVKTFDTAAEMQAYIDGADDTAGWGEMFVAANSAGGYGPEMIEAYRADPHADLVEIWNSSANPNDEGPDGP